jgi:hypothetical protein
LPAPDWLWSLALGPAVRALSLAREAELILARLGDQTLALATTRGDLQARAGLQGLAGACVADDGSTIAAVGAAGELWLFARDLRPQREHTLPAPAVAIATDPFGRYVAASDRQGNLHLLDSAGRELGQVQSPRPIHHLAFIPTQPHLAAAADFGWAGLLDLNSKKWLWSDRPVSNIGALAVAGSGDPMLLACFSDGLRRYAPAGGPPTTKATPTPCGLVAISFAGDRGLAAGAAPQLNAFDARGEFTKSLDLEHAPTALALAALGDRAFIGQANGKLLAIKLKLS